jgi:hypothetical protein
VAEHLWWQCRPAVLLMEGVIPPAPDENNLSVIEKVWAGMNDGQRHRFHKFTCEDDRDPRTVEVIYQMRAALHREGMEDA